MNLSDWKKKVNNALAPLSNSYQAIDWWVRNIDTYVRSESDIADYLENVVKEINRLRESAKFFENSLTSEKKS